MSSPAGEQRNARIVTTTLLLTEHITREDRGSEGNYLLYGSSCAQITEEAEYVKKQLPQISGNKLESKNSMSSSNYSPIVVKMEETEHQLLLVNKENQVLKIKLEATREAGVQALRSASQTLYENYRTRSEELKKRHENDKKQIQAHNLEQERKLQQNTEKANHLAEGITEKCTQITEMEKRVQRMEEVEELNKELRNQDKKIGNLTEKLNALEIQNKELKEKVEFWSGQSKTKISKGVMTDTRRDFGASPYLMLTRIRKQES
ncbi:coiled-coil domain-containing protein 68 isoform X3 [Struthio camelus]|uniref:coiled-coil domain-containing protein 68 isoform X3 n=1 Tax=Struthio camelus TaxID=8801 RepID=UPI0036040B16